VVEALIDFREATIILLNNLDQRCEAPITLFNDLDQRRETVCVSEFYPGLGQDFPNVF
jgi:hypothetical protein